MPKVSYGTWRALTVQYACAIHIWLKLKILPAGHEQIYLIIWNMIFKFLNIKLHNNWLRLPHLQKTLHAVKMPWWIIIYTFTTDQMAMFNVKAVVFVTSLQWIIIWELMFYHLSVHCFGFTPQLHCFSCVSVLPVAALNGIMWRHCSRPNGSTSRSATVSKYNSKDFLNILLK